MLDDHVQVRTYDSERLLERANVLRVMSTTTAPLFAREIAERLIAWAEAASRRGHRGFDVMYLGSFAVRTAARNVGARGAILAIVSTEQPDMEAALTAYMHSIGVDV